MYTDFIYVIKWCKFSALPKIHTACFWVLIRLSFGKWLVPLKLLRTVRPSMSHSGSLTRTQATIQLHTPHSWSHTRFPYQNLRPLDPFSSPVSRRSPLTTYFTALKSMGFLPEILTFTVIMLSTQNLSFPPLLWRVWFYRYSWNEQCSVLEYQEWTVATRRLQSLLKNRALFTKGNGNSTINREKWVL